MADRENKQIEIVKRIETPESEEKETVETFSSDENMHNNKEYYQEEYYQEEYHEEYHEEEESSSRKILPALFGITSIGIMGYFGFNYFNKDSVNQTQNNNTETLVIQKKEPKEITTYTEELAIKQDSKSIEENVIATLSSQKEEQKKERVQEKEKLKEQERQEKEALKEEEKIVKSTPMKTLEALQKEIEKEEKVVKIEKKEEKVVIQKKEPVKKEKIVQKKKPNILKYETIKPRVRTVKRGDTLASIAKRFYGNPMDFKRIIRANSRIRSSKTSLRLGEKIIIPRKDNKKRRRYIIVQRGYTLASIAKKVYGSRDKISKIVHANYRIKTQHSTLRLGQKVYVPQ